MHTLIVEANKDLGKLWKRHLERLGQDVTLVTDAARAIEALQRERVALILLDLGLDEGGAFAVADYAGYRHPDVKIVFVTSSAYFSDGSIFSHVPNACAMVSANAPIDDLAALVDHYGAVAAA